MLISAILPTRHRLEKTLAAALSLSVIEVIDEILIIVDGNLEELNRYKNFFRYRGLKNVRILKNDLARGAQGARITGVKYAKNELIFFLDSDDRALQAGVNMEADALIGDDDLALAYSDLIIGDKKTNFLQLDGHCFRAVLKNLSLCPFSGLMVRKNSIDIARLDTSLPAWQDDDFCLVVAQKGKVKYVIAPAAEYLPSTDSISRSKRKQFKGLSQLLEKWRSLLIEELGYKYLLLWQLRRLSLYFGSLGERDCNCNNKIVSMVCLFISSSSIIVYRAMRRVLRPFFDRYYV